MTTYAAMQAMPEMMQYQHPAYQQTDLADVSMMEAAPAEVIERTSVPFSN